MDVRVALPLVLLAVAIGLTGAVDAALGPAPGFSLAPVDGAAAIVTLAGPFASSPALAWGDPPAHTCALAIVAEDLDLGPEARVFWAVWNMPADQRRLAAGLPRSIRTDGGALQGLAPDRRPGYAPPSFTSALRHRLRFTVFALRTPIDLPAGADGHEVLAAASGSMSGFATWNAGGGWVR